MKEHFGIEPIVDIPKVDVIDEDGRVIAQGYYYYRVNRTLNPCGDSLSEEDVEHCVVCDGFSDWNMPNEPRIIKVTPPHRIRIAKHPYEPWKDDR